MPHSSHKTGVIILWTLGLAVSIAAARYFSDTPLILRPSQVPWLPQGEVAEAAANVAPYLFEKHAFLFRLHIACGISAMTLGLFQFIASLRRARPGVHRFLGFGYVTAVILGSISGFSLSFYILDAVPGWMRSSLYAAVAGFASLAVVWPVVTTIAFISARRRRYDTHRAWMIRSYALTFAAVTVRLVSVPLLLITENVTFTVSASIWSWVLNAAVAEWLIRRKKGVAAARQDLLQAGG